MKPIFFPFGPSKRRTKFHMNAALRRGLEFLRDLLTLVAILFSAVVFLQFT